MAPTHKTETDFIRHEIAVWGEDYVFDLIEQGYVATDVPELGWRFMPVQSSERTRTLVPLRA